MIFLILALISVGKLIYINNINAQMHELYLLDDTIHEIQVLVLQAEPWDTHQAGSNRADKVFTNIDISISAVESFLFGGKLIHDTVIQPVKDKELREKIVALRSILATYKTNLSDTEGSLDQKPFDLREISFFNQFMEATYALDEHFEVMQERQEIKMDQYFWIILILFSLLASITFIGLSAVELRSKKLGELKDEFVNTISHELKTPLAIIKESIYIAQKGREEGNLKKQIKFEEIAKSNADRLARLIKSILDYQKLCAGKMDFNPEMGDINDLVANIGKEMTPLAEKKGLKLKMHLGNDLPKIHIDDDRITQVMVNLVNNAIKFTEKGSISISTEKKGKYIYIKVKDDGIGIKKHELNKIFKSFTKVSVRSAEDRDGTGLGLAISKKIIEQHNGKAWVNSRHMKGSTFYCALPIT